MPFEYFEHTADVGVHAWGPTLPEAFAAAGQALMNLMIDVGSVEERISRELHVEGADREDLLVGWLNELIYRFDAEKLALRRFDVEHLDDFHLHGTGYGEPIDPARQEIRTLVKAATFHGLEIGQQDDGWHIRVILDV